MKAIEIKQSSIPPVGIYEKARDMFGVDFRQGAVFTVGNTIHCEHWPISPDLYEHEKTHVFQQDGYEGGFPAWWERYFDDPYFRYIQELEAYQKQYKYYCTKTKDRNQRARFLHTIASHLTNMYGLQETGLTLQKAKESIQL